MVKKPSPDEMKYAASASVTLSVDDDSDNYKTESVVDFGENSGDSVDVNSDLILAMIAELRSVIKRVVDYFGISKEEYAEFMNERKMISQDSKVVDSIDSAIDNLFQDESN